MTVKELIDKLQEFPEELEVNTYNGGHGDQPVLGVSLEKCWGEEGEDVVFIDGFD